MSTVTPLKVEQPTAEIGSDLFDAAGRQRIADADGLELIKTPDGLGDLPYADGDDRADNCDRGYAFEYTGVTPDDVYNISASAAVAFIDRDLTDDCRRFADNVRYQVKYRNPSELSDFPSEFRETFDKLLQDVLRVVGHRPGTSWEGRAKYSRSASRILAKVVDLISEIRLGVSQLGSVILLDCLDNMRYVIEDSARRFVSLVSEIESGKGKTYDVTLSTSREHLLGLGLYACDDNGKSCYRPGSEYGWAPVYLAHTPNAFIVLVHENDGEKVIGRAWGLFDDSGYLLTNAYGYSIRDTNVMALAHKLCQVYFNAPYTRKPNLVADASHIYLNTDTMAYGVNPAPDDKPEQRLRFTVEDCNDIDIDEEHRGTRCDDCDCLVGEDTISITHCERRVCEDCLEDSYFLCFLREEYVNNDNYVATVCGECVDITHDDVVELRGCEYGILA